MSDRRAYCHNTDCRYQFAGVCGFELAEKDETLRVDDKGQCAIYRHRPGARKSERK